MKDEIRKEKQQDKDVLNNIRIEDKVRMGENRSEVQKLNKYEMAKQRKDTASKLGSDIGITLGFQKYLEDQVEIEDQAFNF